MERMNAFANPPIENKAEKSSFSLEYLARLANQARAGIEDKIVEAFGVDDIELFVIEEGLNRGKAIGEAAGEYLRKVTQGGLAVPQKQYEHVPRSGPIVKDVFDSLKSELLRKKLSRLPSVYATLKQEKLTEFNQEVAPLVVRPRMNEETMQVFKQVIKQRGGTNLVHEVVATEQGAEAISTSAAIQVNNVKGKLIIDIADLLPKDVFLVPIEVAHKAKAATAMNLDHSALLMTYPGTQNTEYEDYCFNIKHATLKNGEKAVVRKEVQYGDLTEPGGFLSLLHEVSHSWQNEYFDDYGRYPFEAWASQVREYSSLYLNSIREKKTSAMKTWYEALRGLGVSFVGNENDEKNCKALLKNLKITTEYESFEEDGRSFTKKSDIHTDIEITSERLPELIEQYVRQERIAWTYAIRVLRFLREQGIDLEPTMKSEKDIAAYVHDCLSTYNDAFEKRGIKPQGDFKKFSRV